MPGDHSGFPQGSLRWSAVAERKQGRAQKNAKVARRGQPHSAKICCMPEKCLKKFAKLVAILGPGLRPSFGSSFGARSFKSYLKGPKRGPKLVPKLRPKPRPKIATNFANFFRHFPDMQQIFARYGVPAFLVRFCKLRPGAEMLSSTETVSVYAFFTVGIAVSSSYLKSRAPWLKLTQAQCHTNGG